MNYTLFKRLSRMPAFSALWCLVLVSAGIINLSAQELLHLLQQRAPTLGTIKALKGNRLVLTSDAGADVNVEVRESTKIVRVAPGQRDLKDAQPIALADLQVGDRILVRGATLEIGQSLAATSIVAMKKADIADKQSRERDEWQKSGVGGLVNSVDAAASVISVTVPSLREKKTVVVHISPQTALRRYAPGSVKFDDAKPAPLSEIRPGDQLRARGEKSTDGSELAAAEIVSGSFRNISGTVSSLDAVQGTITVHDLATKKAVTVKITSESQLRKLPAAIAQRIAQRLNGTGTPAQNDDGQATTSGAPTAKAPAPGAGQPSSTGVPGAAEGRIRESGARGRGLNGGAAGATDLQHPVDFQQTISRLPASTISDLQKGDAVMLVGTGSTTDAVTAITLLAGVEPILQGSPNSASSILSPWSLSSAPSGEVARPSSGVSRLRNHSRRLHESSGPGYCYICFRASHVYGWPARVCADGYYRHPARPGFRSLRRYRQWSGRPTYCARRQVIGFFHQLRWLLRSCRPCARFLHRKSSR